MLGQNWSIIWNVITTHLCEWDVSFPEAVTFLLLSIPGCCLSSCTWSPLLEKFGQIKAQECSSVGSALRERVWGLIFSIHSNDKLVKSTHFSNLLSCNPVQHDSYCQNYQKYGGFPHLSKPCLKFWVISLHEMNNTEKEACEQLLSWNKYFVYRF